MTPSQAARRARWRARRSGAWGRWEGARLLLLHLFDDQLVAHWQGCLRNVPRAQLCHGQGQRAAARLVRPADGPTTTSFERVKEAYLEIKARVTGAIEAEDGSKADQLNLYPLALVLKLLRFYAPRYLGLEPTCTAVEQLLLGRGHDGQDGQQGKEQKASGVPPAEQQQVGVKLVSRRVCVFITKFIFKPS